MPFSLDALPRHALRPVVLALLACQNAAHTLTMRYSRGILKEEYNTGTTTYPLSPSPHTLSSPLHHPPSLSQAQL